MEMITVKQLQEDWKIGRNTAYKLLHIDGFPHLQIGKKILIPKEELDKWVINNMGDCINL